MNQTSYYEVLQVSPNADAEVIQAAYKRLAFKYHPDRNRDGGAEQMMRLLNEAYEMLSDPERRRAYDARQKQADPGVSSHSTIDSRQTPQPVSPQQPTSHARWGWVGALVAGIVLATARYATQQNNARLAVQPAPQPPAAPVPPKPPELPKPLEHRPKFDQQNQFPPPPLFVQQNKVLPTDITAGWTTGKGFHTLVVVNKGADLRDVSLDFTFHKVVGFKFSTRVHWEIWRTGEEKSLIVEAHNYPEHEMRGTALRGFTKVEIDLLWKWGWSDGMPFVRR